MARERRGVIPADILVTNLAAVLVICGVFCFGVLMGFLLSDLVGSDDEE